MSKNNSKYTFTLKNIDIVKIHLKYDIELSQQDVVVQDDITTTTKLTDLSNEKGTNQNTIAFLDESKKLHTCNISMIDFYSKKDINLLRYHCFWCRHPFDSRPIGCPVKYVSNQVIKKYYSNISKDVYTIKENITTSRKNIVDSNNSDNTDIQTNEQTYYQTDGVFCSFNCCKAYITENKQNSMYNNSEILLNKLFNTIMETKMTVINPAPHWRLLQHYGGHLNIVQFRESFNKIDYDYHGTTNTLPVFSPIGTIYEERIKF
jgi:hypothetical protein|tara:strand:+ start:954 stop:1739 length:786 start_codon:yes stop_codon:yes gene_type:complete